MADHAAYWRAAVDGALRDFANEAGPGHINDPLIKLACRLLEIANAPDSPLTVQQAEEMAADAARKLGHDEANIKATLKSAHKRVRDRAAAPPRARAGRPTARRSAPQPSPPPPSPPPSPPPPSPHLEAYAAAHGAPVDVFLAAGWRDASLWEANGRLSETRPPGAVERRALRFETPGGPRWRLIDGLPGPKYWHPAGAHQGAARVWYRLDEALAIAQRAGTLVLANGEASVVVAQYYGIPAATVAGGGERVIPDHLLTILRQRWQGPILVALEGDTHGARAAAALLGQLEDAGYEARAVDLGLSGGEDLADFCARHGSDAWQALQRAPDRRDIPEALAIHWGDAIDTIVAPRQLVRGYLIIGTAALLVGASETGKSTIAVNLACTVAQRYPVIYVAGEDAGNVRAQIRAWELQTGMSRGRIGLVDRALILQDDAEVAALGRAAKRAGARLIVIDTLSACTPGVDENGAEMTAVVGALNRLADDLNATVLAIHHPIKSNAAQYRGHSSLMNNTHTMLVCEREPGDDRVRLTVVRHKGRRADPAWFRLVEQETDIPDPEGGMTIAPVATPAAAIPPQSGQTSPVQMAILAYIYDLAADGGPTSTDLVRAVAQQHGVNESSVRRALSALVRAGLVAPLAHRNDTRKLTADGTRTVQDERARQQAAIPRQVFEIAMRIE